MRHFILVNLLLVLISSCVQDENKKKELELKERELALKERDLAQKDSIQLKIQKADSISKIKQHEDKLNPPDIKVITLISPTYVFGDLAHLMFKDFTTRKEEEYEWDGEIQAITEIMNKCEDHEGCPALKGQMYKATLKFKLMDIEEYNFDKGSLEPTGKKERRWVIIALQKINKE